MVEVHGLRSLGYGQLTPVKIRSTDPYHVITYFLVSLLTKCLFPIELRAHANVTRCNFGCSDYVLRHVPFYLITYQVSFLVKV